MLTTSTESRPSPSRRLAVSSRWVYFSPVSASSNSIRVWRIKVRSGIVYLPGRRNPAAGQPPEPSFTHRGRPEWRISNHVGENLARALRDGFGHRRGGRGAYMIKARTDPFSYTRR